MLFYGIDCACSLPRPAGYPAAAVPPGGELPGGSVLPVGHVPLHDQGERRQRKTHQPGGGHVSVISSLFVHQWMQSIRVHLVSRGFQIIAFLILFVR